MFCDLFFDSLIDLASVLRLPRLEVEILAVLGGDSCSFSRDTKGAVQAA